MAADKSKGTGVQWPFGWGKKKGDKELEALPTPEAEVLKVWPMPHRYQYTSFVVLVLGGQEKACL